MTSRFLSWLDGLIRRFDPDQDLRVVLGDAGRTFIIQLGAVGLNYFSQVLLAVVLGPSEFGVYVFAWSLVAPLSVAAAMGLGSSAVRFVPQYAVSRDWSRIRGFIRLGTLVTLAVGAGIAAIGWWLLPVFAPLTGDEYIDPMRVALLCIPFLALVGLLSGISRGFGWITLAFVPQLLLVPFLVIASVVGLALLVDQPVAQQVLVLAVSACAVTVLGQTVGFRRAIPDEVRSAPPVFETSHWLRVAVPLFLSEGVFLVLWSSDAVMLGSMTAPDEVAIYQACVKTAGLTLLVFHAMAAIAAPRFAALWVEQERADQARFAQSVARWTFVPTMALALGVIVVGPFVLATFGESFVRGYPALIVLALGYMTRTAAGPVASYLAVSGNHNVVVVVTAVAAGSNVLLNLVLIPQFGVMGAASASVLADLLYQAVMYGLVRRRLGVNAFLLARG